MRYRLDPKNDFGSATRVAARGRLDKGMAVLREEREKDPVGAVHQARKEVKKARSLLRLARPGSGTWNGC
jgi:hypothetical protein